MSNQYTEEALDALKEQIRSMNKASGRAAMAFVMIDEEGEPNVALAHGTRELLGEEEFAMICHKAAYLFAMMRNDAMGRPTEGLSRTTVDDQGNAVQHSDEVH